MGAVLDCLGETVKKAVLAFAIVLIALLFTACARREESDVVARVGGSVLTADEFYASIPEQLLAVMSLEDQEEALKTWVKTELLYQGGVRSGLDEDDPIRRRLREIERELVAEEYIKRFMAEVPDVTDEEARRYFEGHRSDYALQVRLAHILVRSRPEAERALGQIRSGTPFETVVANVSIDQTASLGGDLGYMRRGDMIHELEEVAFELKVGEVSDVLPSSYGYHIVKILDRHPGAGQPSFDSRYASVMNFLTSQRRRRAFDDKLAELSGRAVVVVDTAALRVAARGRMRGSADEEALERAEGGSGQDEEPDAR
jgi:peptidyl-prolyl cis-trans isomerase C